MTLSAATKATTDVLNTSPMPTSENPQQARLCLQSFVVAKEYAPQRAHKTVRDPLGRSADEQSHHFRQTETISIRERENVMTRSLTVLAAALTLAAGLFAVSGPASASPDLPFYPDNFSSSRGSVSASKLASVPSAGKQLTCRKARRVNGCVGKSPCTKAERVVYRCHRR